jgi:integrase
MKGHIFQRSPGTWTIVFDVGRIIDPDTGRLKRKQQWETIQGTKKEAQRRLTERLHNFNQGQVVMPSKLTLSQWLDEWMASAIKPHKRLRSYETYHSVVHRHLKPALGHFRLRDLRASHLQAYYQSSKLSKSTLQQHHTILFSSLKAAQKQDMVPRNVADLVIGKPRAKEGHEDAQHHCWNADEAKRFLDAAKAAGPQSAAFYTLALDSGARKAELGGLQWNDVNFDKKTITISRQLVKVSQPPIFGPTKNGRPRTVDLDEKTCEFLRRHKANQAEQRLLLGTSYHDLGLVFTRQFGDPLTINNIGQREFRRLAKDAGVRPIKFHGLRHTCATLLLQAGTSAKVVQERLGHKRIEITLNVYTHVLPSMQQEAAAQLSKLLHG